MKSKWEVNIKLWPLDGILIPGRACAGAARQPLCVLFTQPRAQVCCQTSTHSLPHGQPHTSQPLDDFGVTLPGQRLPWSGSTGGKPWTHWLISVSPH